MAPPIGRGIGMDCATYIEPTGLDDKKRIGALMGTTLGYPGGSGGLSGFY